MPGGSTSVADKPGAGEATVWGVRREELLDLLDRRPAPELGEPPDQLQEHQVPGRKRVRFAAAEEAETLHRPGADLGDAQEAGIGDPLGGVAATGGDVPRHRPQRDRAA